jgi:membrane associated rhomboid family serine protease
MFDHSRLEPQRRLREPIFRVPPATLTLALVLIAIFLVTHLILSPEHQEEIFLRFGFIPTLFLAWLDGQAPAGPALWPLVTHMFLHLDGFHLITNVGFLLAFASPVERRLGWLPVLAHFLVCGVAGALTQVWVTIDPATRDAVLIGASGGIFGVTGAALLLTPVGFGRRGSLLRIMVVLMALNVAIGLASEAGLFGDYLIGWQAHAGGFVMGILIAWPLRRRLQRYP